MPRYCALGCSSVTNRFNSELTTQNSKISLHRFPFKNEDLLNAWLSAIDKPNWFPTPTAALCSRHFDDKCFTKSGWSSRIFLTPNAVPTIFFLESSENKDEEKEDGPEGENSVVNCENAHVEQANRNASKCKTRVLKQRNQISSSTRKKTSQKRKKSIHPIEEGYEQDPTEYEDVLGVDICDSMLCPCPKLRYSQKFSTLNTLEEEVDDPEEFQKDVDVLFELKKELDDFIEDQKDVDDTIEEQNNLDGDILEPTVFDNLNFIQSNNRVRQDFHLCCRFCLCEDKQTFLVFETKLQFSDVILSEVIESCTGIKVSQEDRLSNRICKLCLSKVESICAFREKCKNSDRFLREMEMDNVSSQSFNDNPIKRISESTCSELIEVPTNCCAVTDTRLTDPFKDVCKPASTDKSYSCLVCKERFDSEGVLGVHVKTLHKFNIPYLQRNVQCLLCGKKLRKILLHKHYFGHKRQEVFDRLSRRRKRRPPVHHCNPLWVRDLDPPSGCHDVSLQESCDSDQDYSELLSKVKCELLISDTEEDTMSSGS